jgi:tRNA threonylcarbamoyladenosine modification (KEOPS) complex  Pcc1 subunit
MTSEDKGPKVSCRLRLEFASPDQAEHVHRSIELDNQGFVKTKLEGNTILAEIEASSLNSLLHTLDDFLSCTSVAEKIVSKRN